MSGGYFVDSSTESDTPVKIDARPKRAPVRRQSKRLKTEPKQEDKQDTEIVDLSEPESQSESEDSYKASDEESVSTDGTDASVEDLTKSEQLEDELEEAEEEAGAVEAEETQETATTTRSAKRKTKTKAKPRKKTEEEQSQTRQKVFDRMDSALKEQHPELVSVFDDLAAIGTRIPTEREQPPGLLCRLLPFQREGLDWLIKQEQSPYHGGILADEMGMGKTIQTIALFLSDGQREGPILVIAPTVAVMQWKNEILQYAGPNVKVLVYHGQNRSNDAKVIAENDVVMTTYAVLESCWRKQRSGFTRQGRKVYEKSVLHNMYFHRIVLDEAHNIKDRHASTTVAVFHLQAKYRLCLSGTPLQNRIGELYSLLRFLQIEPFCQYFCTKCDCKSNEWHVKGQRCTVCNHVAMQHVNFFNHSLLKHILKLKGQQDMAISRMRLLLNTLMLRRTKVERADDLGLPPRIVNVRRDYFNEEEKDLYNSVFSDSSRTFSTYVNQGVVLNNYANIFTLITRMRQIADHPDLVLRRANANGESQIEAHVCRLCDDEAEDPIKSRCSHIFCRMCIREYVEGWTGEESDLECPVCHIKLAIDLEQAALEVDQEVMVKGSIVNRIRMDDSWRSSTKIEALLEELFKLRSDRCTIKSIVFSQFTSVLDLVEWRLARAGFKSVKLQGSMSPSQRDGIIRYFMETPSVEVFLVSLKAGGVALNLCEASQVFLMDPWWNPSVEWQSGDRVHRIGQHRPVTITRLIIEDSIESKILELQEKKANMINATIGSDDAALNRLTQGDMEFLFQN